MPIDINIVDLVGADWVAPANPLDDTMSQALEAPRGIELEFTSNKAAQAMRFKFYRRRRDLKAAGVVIFDKLLMSIEGNLLKMVREPDFKTREL